MTKYLFLLCLLLACSSKPPKSVTGEKSVSIESLQLASELHSSFVTEVKFPKAESGLSPLHKDDLRKLFSKASQKGKIEAVKLITWADREYPSVHKKQLTGKELDLVRERNKTIEEYLRSLDADLDVEGVSMAKRPGYFKSLFSGEEVRMKKSLETAGIPNTDSSIKEPSKASVSIVIFILKQ